MEMSQIPIEQLETKIDSLYRLVVLAARRASQLSKPDARPLVRCDSRKPALIALHEVLQDKVKPRIGGSDEEDYLE
jgi:DNA-directed RNA polymerase omega subunit